MHLRIALEAVFRMKALASESPCQFELMEQLKDKAAACLVHEQHCEIQQGCVPSFAFIWGFSCVDFSMQKHNSEKARADVLDDILEQGTGSSGHTFREGINHVTVWTPLYAMWENTKYIFDKEGKRKQQLTDAFQSAGYTEASCPQNSTDWCLYMGS